MTHRTQRFLVLAWRRWWWAILIALAFTAIVATTGCTAEDAMPGLRRSGSQEQRSVEYGVLDDGRRAAVVHVMRIETWAEPKR